jgi:predicted nucleotidyltransferase
MIETEITIPNECSFDKVGSDYKPIVQSAIDSYKRSLDKLLVSIRLMGSVARGESVFAVSDIDFVALVSMNPDAHQRDTIESDARKLTLNQQCVRKVDLEIEIKGRVSPSRELIFRTDSICIFGTDDYSSTETRISNTTLAKLITPDFNSLMSGYRQRIKSSIDGEELGKFGRSVGKDVLKCFRRYLILHYGVYRKSASDIHTQLAMYYPEHIETFNCLLRIYEQPVERQDELLQILKMAQTSYESLGKASL